MLRTGVFQVVITTDDGVNNKVSNIVVIIIFLIAGLMAYGLLMLERWMIDTEVTSDLRRYVNDIDIASLKEDADSCLRQLDITLALSEASYGELRSDLSNIGIAFWDSNLVEGKLGTSTCFSFMQVTNDMQKVINIIENLNDSIVDVAYTIKDSEQATQSFVENIADFTSQLEVTEDILMENTSNEVLIRQAKDLRSIIKNIKSGLSMLHGNDVTLVNVVVIELPQ